MSTNRRHIRAGLGLIAVSLLLQATAVLAQSPAPMSPTEIMSATQASDVSSSWFRALLGNFWDSPLSLFGQGSGGGSGLLGGMFMVFNAAVFSIGVLWASYGVGSSVVETAQTGEALGKRMSPIWMPIRMVTGISSIVPIFGGFSLAQVVMVGMAAIGIGIANLMTNSALNSASNFTGVVSPAAAFAEAPPLPFDDAARTLFQMYVCQAARQEDEATGLVGPNDTVVDTTSITRSGQELWAYSLGSRLNPRLCGKVALEQSLRSSSSYGYRNNAVQYGALADSVSNSAKTAGTSAMNSLASAIRPLATAWYAARKTSGHNAFPAAQVAAAAKTASATYAAGMSAGLSNANAQTQGGAISSQVLAKMRADGWVGLGAWYGTFAEVDAAVAAAVGSTSISTRQPDAPIGGSVVLSALTALANSELDTAGPVGSGSGSVSADTSESWTMSWLCQKLFYVTSTGNCSIGQAAVAKAIKVAQAGSGGGNLLNPITMMKNLGDTSLGLASVLYTVEVLMPDDDGLVGKAANLLPGGGIVKGAVMKVLKGAAAMAPYLLIVGLLMSVYIPLIPFITWMGGLIQYAVIFCQAIVSAPIGGLAHLEAEGEGMGRRTEPTYIFILNLLFRPAFMVFGFFFASALLVVIGTYQANAFLDAMANAQGNSMTGLFSVLGYLAAFLVLNITLIQGLFNMITLLPDQGLGLLGNAGIHAELGKETEGKLHATFMSVGRGTQTLAFSGKGARPPAPSVKAGATGGGKPKEDVS